MENLVEILNCIGDFFCYISNNVVSFPGTLNDAKKNIVLQCKMEVEWYQKIDHYSPLNMWGNVNGIPVSLLNVYLNSGTHRGKGTCISLTFDPSEIVIGQSYSTEIQVTQMSISISALNYMFSSSPLQSVYSVSKDHPSVLNYTFPDMIEADDIYGHLRIYQTFKKEWTHNNINYKILPIIEYQFHHPMEIMDAVAKIATVRNLFTFFANHYLPLENISFTSTRSESEENPSPCECVLFLNSRENIPIPQEPFLITTAAFSEKFEILWSRWLQIYEEATYIPTLFYEIICNRSTRVNRFLNLSQAVEVYSKRYRKENVVEIARMRERTRRDKEPPIHLNHRFEDIFLLLNPYLEMEESKISIIAKSLADMRNFFTHYDETKYIEPSYQEMLAACHVLEFILLAIIYHDIGISSKDIKNSKKRIEFQRFDEFIEVLTKDYLKTTKQ